MKNELINIAFENDHFIFCDKPASVLTTPDRHHSDRPCLGLALQKKLNRQIFPVHRIDYEVSGLVIFAKSDKAHRVSQEWFEKKSVIKTYKAITRSQQSFLHWPTHVPCENKELKPQIGDQFFWTVKIHRGKRRSFEAEHGQLAETQAELTQIVDQFFIWHLSPITGKPHQLRLEMSRHGFPLLNDALYGGENLPSLSHNFWPYQGIGLRSLAIRFLNEPQAQMFQLPLSFALN